MFYFVSHTSAMAVDSVWLCFSNLCHGCRQCLTLFLYLFRHTLPASLSEREVPWEEYEDMLLSAKHIFLYLHGNSGSRWELTCLELARSIFVILIEHFVCYFGGLLENVSLCYGKFRPIWLSVNVYVSVRRWCGWLVKTLALGARGCRYESWFLQQPSRFSPPP